MSPNARTLDHGAALGKRIRNQGRGIHPPSVGLYRGQPRPSLGPAPRDSNPSSSGPRSTGESPFTPGRRSPHPVPTCPASGRHPGVPRGTEVPMPPETWSWQALQQPWGRPTSENLRVKLRTGQWPDWFCGFLVLSKGGRVTPGLAPLLCSQTLYSTTIPRGQLGAGAPQDPWDTDRCRPILSRGPVCW